MTLAELLDAAANTRRVRVTTMPDNPLGVIMRINDLGLGTGPTTVEVSLDNEEFVTVATDAIDLVDQARLPEFIYRFGRGPEPVLLTAGERTILYDSSFGAVMLV